MIWFLFIVAIVVASVIFVWDFRRKAVARETASKKRFEEMFAARQAAGAAPAGAATDAPSKPVVMPEPKPQAPAVAPVQRFLGPAETLVYRLLRASIPDHEIFANVSLASVIGASGAGYDREQQLRKLAQYRLDFVVCDKSMRVVSAVEIETAGGAQTAGDAQFRADTLKAAGIALVRLNAKALPRREELRALVCGTPAPVGAVAAGPEKSG